MSLDACADLVARGDPDRFHAVMASPVEARARLLPVFAFNVEVSRAPWVTEEPMIAEMRLQWWRDMLDEIREDRPVRAHEVATALAGVIDEASGQVLDALVAARRWDIYKETFEDEGHFESYLDATGGGLVWVSARTLGAEAAKEAAYRDVGYAAALAAFFKAVPALEARGRKPLIDGRPAAVCRLAEDALARLIRGVRAGATGPATFPAWLTGKLLRQAIKSPDRVASDGLAASEFSRRGRLIRTSLTGRVPI